MWNDLAAMNGAQKQALRERRILNRTAVEKNGPGGLYLSEDESCSLLLGGRRSYPHPVSRAWAGFGGFVEESRPDG